MGFFEKVKSAPSDAIFGRATQFHIDPRILKVNLTVGYYKDEKLKTPVLECVKKAEAFLLENEKSKEYLPIDGDKNFTEQIGLLVFGESFWQRSKERIHASQSVGGTGALMVAAHFLKQEVASNIYISEPTWQNHKNVFNRAGMRVFSYPYYDAEKQRIDFDKLYDFLSTLSPLSVIVFHASCHNPTGADLSDEQWKILSDLILSRKMLPFFDFAYQGFKNGLEEDAYPVRLFAEAGHEMIVASSYSKNFGLYGERVGGLFMIASSKEEQEKIATQVRAMIRSYYSNPPRHGCQIVSQILQSQELKRLWELELAKMRERMIEMHLAFSSALNRKPIKADFSFLKDRHGLFSFTGLAKEQVDRLIAEYGIYMTADGRINVTGLNWDNLDYVVDAILRVI